MVQDIAAQREQFRQDGYVIVRDVIPVQQLPAMRGIVDELVARERDTDPTWNTCPIPRADLAKLVDPATVGVIEITLQDSTLGMSRRLLDCPPESIALNFITVLCNPEFEPTSVPPPGQASGTDPRNWHRDIRPDHDGPLNSLITDIEANGPAYAQWNIALYDDAILHVIPGSHQRLNSEVEINQLQRQSNTPSPLSGGTCVELNPGDGVVYNNMLLHWGSRYTNRQKRRTIQIAYRSFGCILPNQCHCQLTERIVDLFPVDAPQRHALEHWFALFREESAVIGDVFRALLADDAGRFTDAVARLHPGNEGRLTCIILLSIIARNLLKLTEDPDSKAPDDGQGPLGVELQWQLSRKFTSAEVRQLWKRFQPLDEMLRTKEPGHVRGFLGPPTNYAYEMLPLETTTDGVMAAIFAAP